MPTVTTIIPTYNRENYIGEAIDSILAQSRPVDEIIVVDDGSTDNTSELLKSYGDRIRYVRQQNSGPGAARNRGIREASGDFITFLDSDDLWVRDKTETQMDFFERHPHLDLVFGDMANFTDTEDDNRPEIKNQATHDYLEAHAADLEKILDCLIEDNIVPTPSVMIKREAVHRIGFFDEKLRIGEDYDYWLRASVICRIGFVNAILAKRRRHAGNLVSDWLYRNQADIEVLSRIASTESSLPRRTRELLEDKLFRIHYDLGSHYFKKKDFRNAYFHLNRKQTFRFSSYKRLIKLFLSFLLQGIHSLK